MIGDNIRSIRLKRGFTQAQLGDLVNVSEKTVSSWEINRTEPKMGKIEQLAEALGCRKSDLIGESMNLSHEEYILIKKFRALDDYGIRAVVSTINNEYDRCLDQDREKEKRSSAG